jgi:hypothetical protein
MDVGDKNESPLITRGDILRFMPPTYDNVQFLRNIFKSSTGWLGCSCSTDGPVVANRVGLGLVLPVVALIFWNLDRRTAFLVKHAEECLIDVETSLLDERVRLFSLEPEKTQAACSQEMFRHRLWTYGRHSEYSLF